MILTLFRLAAVIFGIFYLKKIVEKKYHPGFIICAALIFSGALGNLIDSMFYGLIFEESSTSFPSNIAKIFPAHGYAGFLHGKVVDMLYFPIIRDAHFPLWVPVWGGQDFEFFRPIFNLADASISIGIIAILLFQKRFFKTNVEKMQAKAHETQAMVNDEVQVS
jgi:signal peptidase II